MGNSCVGRDKEGRWNRWRTEHEETMAKCTIIRWGWSSMMEKTVEKNERAMEWAPATAGHRQEPDGRKTVSKKPGGETVKAEA